VLVAVLTDRDPSDPGEERKAHQRTSTDRGERAATAPTPPGTPGTSRTRPHPRRNAEDVGEWSVYVIGAGGGRARLTASTPSEVPVTPAWSRSGAIAYVRPRCDECDAAVWVDRRKLSSRLGNLTDPAWSPGGGRLAAVKVGAGLYSLSARDGEARALLGRAVVEDPAWSPSGEEILFARRLGASNWDLYAIPSGGGGLRRLTRSRAQELSPDWSPDGRRVAFQRQDRSGAWSLYVMRADGSGVRRLVVGSTQHGAVQPAWSPDGRSIAYVGVTLEGTRVEVARPGSGRPPRRITGSGLQAADPDWSPDGRRIVFSGRRGGE
jgi:TolB protein